jgi:signal transduction histidine kinase
VAAFGPPAVDFSLTYRNRAFADVPMVAAGSELRLKGMKPRQGDVMVIDRWTFTEVVENILRLRPDTRRILVVFGSSPHERRLTELAREDLQLFADRVLFQFTNDMSLTELQQQLARLGPDAAVLLGILDSDVNGLVLSDKTSLAVVKAASPVPVFGFFDDQLGHGIVGGPLIQLRLAGTELANSAIEVLGGGAVSEALRIMPLSAPTYDWRELQKFHIDEALLPPGSRMQFKPLSAWEEYSRWAILVMILFLAQSALILALLAQRRSRQAAEQYSLTLSRRLISAHEDEHRRLARELHDDLSQRLARLSIDAGYLAANPGSAAALEVARSMQPELASLGKDIHDLSYRLHPSLVDDLGIEAALRNEAERIRLRNGITVVQHVEDIQRDLPHDAALALFRIAQEALGNAVRHASPSAIELSLRHEAGLLTLIVRDDGSGFDTNAPAGRHGLGLYSMRERIRALHGSLNVRSSPGSGTTVVAAIPLPGAVA